MDAIGKADTHQKTNMSPGDLDQFDAKPYSRGFVVFGEKLIAAARFLRDQKGYTFLRDIAAVDWLKRRTALSPSQWRFDVCYQLANLETGHALTLKCCVDDGASLPSMVPLFPSAEFMEREVYDLMGIGFTGHPDLRRILLSYDWEGHPLRKDYPTTGYEMWDWQSHK